jgi:hypothetical protein
MHVIIENPQIIFKINPNSSESWPPIVPAKPSFSAAATSAQIR